MFTFIKRQWVVKRTLLRSARQVHDRGGRPLRSQLADLARLRRGPGQLRAIDYYMFGAYDDRRFPPPVKRELSSWDRRRLARALNDPSWSAVCDDKLLFYAVMRGLGLPILEVRAVHDARGRAFGSTPVLRSVAEIAAFLRDGMPYPVFGKPVRGSFGQGASALVGYAAERDAVLFRDGGELGVEEYLRGYVLPAREGYLFQEPLRQHPALDRVSGGRVGTLRMVVLRDDPGPRLFRVVWRIPVGGNVTDNFLHGARGNLVAHVDRETGRVGRVVQPVGIGAGADGTALAPEVEAHPDTGERIPGLVIPDWPGVVALCLRAATSVPGLRYQSWDLAIGADGPVLMELNFRGGLAAVQAPAPHGILDAEFRDFWGRHARHA